MSYTRKFRIVPTLLAFAALCLTGVSAQAGPLDGFTVGPRLSTLGWGVEVTRDFTRFFTVRGGPTFMMFGFNREFSGIDYDTEVEFINGFLLADFHPIPVGFRGLRVTGGIYAGTNKIGLDATPSQGITIGDTFYPAGDVGSIDGEIDLNSFAPYVGLGYSGGIFGVPHLNIDLDLGVKFGGSPDVSLEATGPAAAQPTFQSELDKEAQKIEDDIDFLQYYPVISLGVSYRF